MKYFFKNMFAVSIALIFCSIIAQAKIITCSNNPNSPGMTTDLQYACDSLANNGDTILVSGSPNTYNISLSVKKPLTIIGPGANPKKDYPFRADISSLFIDSDNCIVEGLYIGQMYIGWYGMVRNISVIRNSIPLLIVNRTNNINIINNLINNIDTYSGSTRNLFVYNNIIGYKDISKPYGNYSSIQCRLYNTDSNIIVANNTFILGYNSDYDANNYSGIIFFNSLVYNNIFYCQNRIKWPLNYLFFYVGTTSTGTNNVFKNNVVFNDTLQNPFFLDTSGTFINYNAGKDNYYKIDPKFTNLQINNGTIDFDNSDFSLLASSPCKTLGTSGSEVGAYGGKYPFPNSPITGNPAIPQLQKMDIKNLVISPGDSLNVNIRAKGFK